MDQPGGVVEVLEAVPGEGHGVADLPLGQDAQPVHQLLIGVAPVQAAHDLVHVPGRPRAIDQHDRALLDPDGRRARLQMRLGMRRQLLLDRDGMAFEGNVPQLADVPEHQHVRIQIERAAPAAGELWNGEARKREVGA